MRKRQPTKATIARRVEEVLRIRLDGAEFWDVREYAREKEAEEGSAWHLAEGEKPLSDGQLRRYVSRVDRMIAESCRASRRKLLRRHLAQRRNLYAKAVAQGDIRVALSVLADEAKLLGLYAPVKTALTNPEGTKEYGALTDAERAAALARIYAQVGAGSGSPHSGESADADGSAMGRSSPDSDGRGNAARRMAGTDPSSGLDTGIAPLFPPSRQEPSGGGAGIG